MGNVSNTCIKSRSIAVDYPNSGKRKGIISRPSKGGYTLMYLLRWRGQGMGRRRISNL
jgi:hypothetical protein